MSSFPRKYYPHLTFLRRLSPNLRKSHHSARKTRPRPGTETHLYIREGARLLLGFTDPRTETRGRLPATLGRSLYSPYLYCPVALTERRPLKSTRDGAVDGRRRLARVLVHPRPLKPGNPPNAAESLNTSSDFSRKPALTRHFRFYSGRNSNKFSNRAFFGLYKKLFLSLVSAAWSEKIPPGIFFSSCAGSGYPPES